MPDLKDIFKTLEQSNANCNISGYFDNAGDFVYDVSSNNALPAAVAHFDYLPRNSYIFTNLPTTHWLYTYTAAKGNGPGLIFVDSKGMNTGRAAAKYKAANTRSLRMLAGDGGEGPLGTSGGLYDAAKTLRVYNKDKDGNSKDRGLHRALRYYMLAAYAVLGKCANEAYGGGNYVCAMAVSDSGKILSWGVNSGYFHHGEVNMLLNYFSKTGTKQLPPKTLVFSTLTPCKQCSNYLQEVRPDDSVVFMGQQDTGEFGKVGEAHGIYLSDLTDPVKNRYVYQQTEKVYVGDKPVPHRFKRGATYWQPVYENQTFNYADHYSVDQALESMVTSGNIAKQVGQRCQREMIDSYNTLGRKFVKDRGKIKDLQDQRVKIAVLTYLDGWLQNVQSSGIVERNIPV